MIHRTIPALLLLVLSSLGLGGCVVAGIVSAMGQSAEYQKLIEVPAKYRGLENRTVAVVVQADLATLYDFPTLVPQVMGGVWGRIAQHVPGVQLLPPQTVIAWQHVTPQWGGLAYGEMAEGLGVDRVVFIEIHEFRLHPVGNSWLWDGACVADVGIIERDALDPDLFVETFPVQSLFPGIEGLGRESATQGQIEMGVIAQFVRNVGWLFYDHEEPKYPEHYRGDVG